MNNTMNNVIEGKLKIVRGFQQKHPTSHLGGSLGLLLLGVDLGRDLYKSDIDITIDELNKEDETDIVNSFEQRSENTDFDLALKQEDIDGHYTKIDIRICPEPSFIVVEYQGFKYNVSKLRDILYWKKRYANNGSGSSIKHINDLIKIDTGVRPIENNDDWLDEYVSSDDLPF